MPLAVIPFPQIDPVLVDIVGCVTPQASAARPK